MKPEATEWQGTVVRRRFIVGRAAPGFHVATVFSNGAWALYPDPDGQAIARGDSGGEAACDAAAVEHADKLRWRLPGTPASTAPSVAAAAVLTAIHARTADGADVRRMQGANKGAGREAMTERRLRVEVVEARSEYGHPAHWIGVGGGTSTQDRVAALRMLAEIIEEFDARRILTCIWEEHGTIKTEAGTGGADENAATLEVLRTVARRWHGRLI